MVMNHSLKLVMFFFVLLRRREKTKQEEAVDHYSELPDYTEITEVDQREGSEQHGTYLHQGALRSQEVSLARGKPENTSTYLTPVNIR